MIVTTGFNELRDLINGTGTVPSHFGMGTGTTDPTISDTTLETEVDINTGAGERQPLADGTTTVTVDQEITWSGELLTTEGNSNDLSEIGLFNASTAGDMFFRTEFFPLSKSNSITLQVDITMRLEQ